MLHFFIGRGYEDTDADAPRYYVTDLPIADVKDGSELYGMQYDDSEEPNKVNPVYVADAKDPQYLLETNTDVIAELEEVLKEKTFLKKEGERSIYHYKQWLIKQDFIPPRWYQYKIQQVAEPS